MICPVCKQRWAIFSKKDFKFVGPHGKIKMFFSRITLNLIKRNGYYPKHKEAGFNRGVAWGSNEIKCCGDWDCRKAVLLMIGEFFPGDVEAYDALVEETKKELVEGKIK